MLFFYFKLRRQGRKEMKKMSEGRQKRKEVIEAELQKTKAELALAKHRQAKLHNQIKGFFLAFICPQSSLEGRAQAHRRIVVSPFICRKADKAPQGAHTRSVYKCAPVKRSTAAFSVGDKKSRKRRGIHISTKMIHLNAQIISRGGEKPQLAVASAAYRSGTKIYCEYDGEIKDFARKGHVICSKILLRNMHRKNLQTVPFYGTLLKILKKGAGRSFQGKLNFYFPVNLMQTRG